MFHLRGSTWGPFPLPEFLSNQLEARGFSHQDAGRCARLIGEQPSGTQAAAALFVDLGSCKFLEADIDGAIAAWRHAITSGHEAEAARSLLNLGLLHEHLHLHERALVLLSRVSDLDVSPYVVPAAMAAARCHVACADDDLAMETMARLAQRVMASGSDGPELSEALYGLGEIAENAERPDRAERAWRAAMAGGVGPIQHKSMERLARLLLAGGHNHAAADLLVANTFEVDDADPVFIDAAEIFLQRGEKQLAGDVLALVNGARCKPNDRFRLADAKMACSQVNGAIDELEALLAEPDEHTQVRALFSLGNVYAAHDMIDPARSMFERVVSARDDYWSGAAELALGDLMAATAEPEAATEYWSRAVADGEPAVADQARARLAGQATSAAEHHVQTDTTQADSARVVIDSIDAPEPETSGDAQLISLDSIDPNADLPDVTAAASGGPAVPVLTDPEVELVEPQVISLEPIEADVALTSGSAEFVGEPVVVALEALAHSEPSAQPSTGPSDRAADNGSASTGSKPQAASPYPATGPATSSFADHLGEPNPYAALAPDHDDTASNDVRPTTRNPYAELAPNFDDVEPPPDVEPGDWESMLQDWPRSESAEKPKKRSSAFSRYT